MNQFGQQFWCFHVLEQTLFVTSRHCIFCSGFCDLFSSQTYVVCRRSTPAFHLSSVARILLLIPTFGQPRRSFYKHFWRPLLSLPKFRMYDLTNDLTDEQIEDIYASEWNTALFNAQQCVPAVLNSLLPLFLKLFGLTLLQSLIFRFSKFFKFEP
jgi:hypothetical protein